jgi:V8-like Glu-specific endopeptidase
MEGTNRSLVIIASAAALTAAASAQVRPSLFEDPTSLNIPAPTPEEDVSTGDEEAETEEEYGALGYTVVTSTGAVQHVKIDRNKVTAFKREAKGAVEESASGSSDTQSMMPDETEKSVLQDLPYGAPVVKVADQDIAETPYRLTGRFSLGCTGTMIGRRQILTAAHCVYNYKTNRYHSPKSLRFRLGQHGTFAAGRLLEMDRIYAPDGYTVHHRSTSDYAIVITKQDIPEALGRMVFGVSHETVPYGTTKVHINGYPAFRGYRMFHTHCLGKPYSKRRLLYACDTYGGMSGSAVYMLYPSGKRVIYGIHSGTWDSKYNRGVRITEPIFLQLREWKRKHD